MCLKFQLTKISTLFKVAAAMCKQSLKLVSPTTFSSIYFSARRIASSPMTILSILALGKSLKYSRTFSGAFVNSTSDKLEKTQITFPSFTLSNSWSVASSNSLSKHLQKPMCQNKNVVSYRFFLNVKDNCFIGNKKASQNSLFSISFNTLHRNIFQNPNQVIPELPNG